MENINNREGKEHKRHKQTLQNSARWRTCQKLQVCRFLSAGWGKKSQCVCVLIVNGEHTEMIVL